MASSVGVVRRCHREEPWPPCADEFCVSFLPLPERASTGLKIKSIEKQKMVNNFYNVQKVLAFVERKWW
jgi:hypothetical protein